VAARDFGLLHEGGSAQVIEVHDSQLITSKIRANVPSVNGKVAADLDNDILKVAVINRYQPETKPAVALVKNFGLKKGAIGSSVAHDSHNIIVVGTNDEDMARAVNLIVENNGGLSAVDGRGYVLKLPVAGLMSNEDGFSVAKDYIEVDKMAKGLGCTLQSPFMTLSFMALLVIPQIKLSDKGLFDGESFTFTNVFSSEKEF